MATVSTPMLGVLPNDMCMLLFNKCAFREEEEHRHPNLIKIGEEFVKECGGIPLAVRTLGSLLYSSTDENDWKCVRNHDIWKLRQKEDDILPALKLSYYQLPSYLKQCFVYCSLFPKDYKLTQYELVHFWMAHGLLQTSDKNEDPESIGMQYFKELVSSSFFQDFEVGIDLFHFKMHDLIPDLAILVADSECLLVKSSKQLVSKKPRHLSFVGINISEHQGILNFLSSLDNRVRTIYFPFGGEGANQQIFESCISRFRFLRMLNVRGSSIEFLPKRIGNLKHLRYLDLRSCKMKKLPNSIWKLQSLETLLLRGCEELYELPRGIKYLIGLKTFSFTTKQKWLRDNEIVYLNSLRNLEIDRCANLEYLFQDIHQLKELLTLEIDECPNLISLPRGMKYLSSLERLIISRCVKLDLNFGMELEDNDLKINDSLKPHLRLLEIVLLPNLVQLPQWLLHASANNLQLLRIAYCPNFKVLPDALQNIKSLQILEIISCPKLTCLPENLQYLTALRKLTIEKSPTLRGRCKKGTGEDWPKIAHIPQIKVDKKTIQLIT